MSAMDTTARPEPTGIGRVFALGLARGRLELVQFFARGKR